MVQLIFVKVTMHPALHIVTTESNEYDARPGITCAAWAPAGRSGKSRVQVCVDCTLSPFGRRAMRGTAARTMFVARCISCQKVAHRSRVKDGPSFYGGGININCFEEDGGCKGIVVGGGRATICII